MHATAFVLTIYTRKNVSVEGGAIMIKAIKDYPDYLISSIGEVWSRKRKKYLKWCLNHDGYRQVILYCENGKAKTCTIHRLVLKTFVGMPLNNQESRHINGIRTDNSLENLCWGTKKENAADRTRHGTTSKGENHGRAKLTEADVQDIRRYYASGCYSQYELAKIFNINQVHVGRIVRHKTWKHIKI